MAWLRVGDPRGRTRIEPLDGDRAVVGRSTSCEIRIDDPDVALRHVSILKTERGYLIVNETGSRPILRGDEAVNNHFMVPEVPYRIGASTLVLTEEAPDDALAADESGRATTDALGHAPTIAGEPSIDIAIVDDDDPEDAPDDNSDDNSNDGADRAAKAGTESAPGDGTADADADDRIDGGPDNGAAASGADDTQPPPSTDADAPAATQTQPPDDAVPPPSATPTIAATDAPGARTGKTEPGTEPSPASPPTTTRTGKTEPGPPTPPPPQARRTSPPPPPPPDGAPPWARATPSPRPPAPPQPGAPPVRFPASAEPTADPQRAPERASDSWVWRKQDDSQSGSGPSIYSMGDGVPVVHASSQSWNWHEGRVPPARLEPQIDLPPETPPPPPPPAVDPRREPEPPSRPERSGVRPVLLRPSQTPEPPLPAVSKELSSGHSWLWALPSSVRDGSEPGTMLGGRDRPLIFAGIALMLIGALLIGISFAVGLSPSEIGEWIGGRR